MQLKYKKTSLVALAMAMFAMALFTIFIGLFSAEDRGGLMGFFVDLLGSTAAKILVTCVAIFAVIGAFRLIRLTSHDGLAAAITASGVQIRSTYYAGFLPWSLIASIEMRTLAGWGSDVIVINRADEGKLLLRMIGLGRKIVIQPRHLENDAVALGAWLEAACNRGNTQERIARDSDISRPDRLFGRR